MAEITPPVIPYASGLHLPSGKAQQERAEAERMEQVRRAQRGGAALVEAGEAATAEAVVAEEALEVEEEAEAPVPPPAVTAAVALPSAPITPVELGPTSAVQAAAPEPVPVRDLSAPLAPRLAEAPATEVDEGKPAAAPPAPTAVATPGPGEAQPLLFEVAWEVCWQLGGIYTVLRSKAASMVSRWNDRYCLIGPYNPNTAAVEFEETPTHGVIRQALDRLREAGIPCHFGRWLIAGRPHVILLDYRARFHHMDVDKYLMWKDHGISTVANDGEVNEIIAFGFTVAEFFRHLCAVVAGSRPLIAQFHEWMGGLAVPRLAHLQLPVATVFTTHATLLGRYLASNNPDFYHQLPYVDPEAEARHFNIYTRHQIEKAAAHASTVFTTVSEVTAREAEKLLGRRPDVILPNGLNIQRFAALHEFQNLHRQYKERIHEFVMSHFFPSYTFDLDRTLYLFTSGRYEYRNKGMDMFIEALHQLNQQLRQVPDPPTVVGFIITRAATRNVNVNVLQNRSMFDELQHTCRDLQEQMGHRLFLGAVRGRLPTLDELLTDDAQVRLKRSMHAWRTGRQPLIVTHDLVDDATDPILRHLRHRGLLNSGDDPVKAIFHADFATATNPPLNMDYEQFVRGCHMGVFPSYYEPWGYTPMECVALGLPTVTTDLSGFGAYVQGNVPEHAEQGVYVLNRGSRGFDQSTTDLANHLLEFAQMTRRQRIELRNRAERLSEVFDWSRLVRHYDQAHNLALERRGVRREGVIDVRMV
jgi:glycogen(starch) synthase